MPNQNIQKKSKNRPLWYLSLIWILALKEETNETNFSIFLYISVQHRSLTLLIKFFEIRIRTHGDIHIRKSTPRYQRYGESSTLRIADTESCWLPVSLMRGVAFKFFFSETPWIVDVGSCRLCVLLIQRVGESAYCWYGESTTLHIVDAWSRGLCVSLIRRVVFVLPVCKICMYIYNLSTCKCIPHSRVYICPNMYNDNWFPRTEKLQST